MDFIDYSIRGEYLEREVWWTGELWSEIPDNAKCYPSRKEANRDKGEIPSCYIEKMKVMAFDGSDTR